MLVVSRKAGELIRIGDEITIVVIHSEGSRVRIGIQAPQEVSVIRPARESSPPVARPEASR